MRRAGRATAASRHKMTVHVLFTCALVSLTDSLSIPTQARCQSRCLQQYAQRQERRLLSGAVVENEFDVSNNTQFSLCKLGCSTPGFGELALPAFVFGQAAGKEAERDELSDTVPSTVSLPSALSSLSLLCVETRPSNGSLYGRIELQMNESMREEYGSSSIVHYVEGIRKMKMRGVSVERTFWSAFIYSSSSSFSAPSLPVDGDTVQFRGLSFNATGALGTAVKTRWYKASELTATSANRVQLEVTDQIWKADAVSVQLVFVPPPGGLAVCSAVLTWHSQQGDNRRELDMDRSMGLRLEPLSFEHVYRVALLPAEVTREPRPSTLSPLSAREDDESGIRLITASCLQLVDDASLCAPPPVSDVQWRWNSTDTVMLSWRYGEEGVEEISQQTGVVSVTGGVSYPRSVHFSVVVNPLVTPGEYQCQYLDSQRRTVGWAHRAVLVYVSDARCNYEVEVVVTDARNRRSPLRKTQFIRHTEAAAGQVAAMGGVERIQMIALVIAAVFVLVSVVSSLALCHRHKNNMERLRRSISCELRKNVIMNSLKHDGTLGDPAWCTLGTSKRVVGGGRRALYSDDDDEAQSGGSSCDRHTGQTELSQGDRYSADSARSALYPFYDQFVAGAERPRSECIPRPPTISPPRLLYASVSRQAAMHGGRKCVRQVWADAEQGLYTDADGYNFVEKTPARPLSELRVEMIDEEALLGVEGVSVQLGGGGGGVEKEQEEEREDEYVAMPHLNVPTYSPSELRLCHVIGRGKYGVVGLAVIKQSERAVAVKYSPRPCAESRACMSAEMRAARQLCTGGQHMIVQCVGGLVNQAKLIALLYEFCEGGDMKAWLRASADEMSRAQAGKSTVVYQDPSCVSVYGPSSPSLQLWCEHVVHSACHIASAVNFLHVRGVVHRDIACRNVLLARQWQHPLIVPHGQGVKLADFGLSVSVSDPSPSVSPCALPTEWLAPEVLDQQGYTMESDVWEFGCLLVELLTVGGDPSLGMRDSTDRPKTLRKRLTAVKSGMNQIDGMLRQLMTVARGCLEPCAQKRPTIGAVLSQLTPQQPDLHVSRQQSLLV